MWKIVGDGKAELLSSICLQQLWRREIFSYSDPCLEVGKRDGDVRAVCGGDQFS
jgi:hypothetical protein